MFTIEEIKMAHSNVKSGADFPNYIQDLINFGVTSYVTYVTDGHTIYIGKNDYKVQSEPKYLTLSVAEISVKETFLNDLRNHQNGNTDYPTFCNDCAKSGIEKWVVNTENMTCIYYDKLDNEILVEKIPRT